MTEDKIEYEQIRDIEQFRGTLLALQHRLSGIASIPAYAFLQDTLPTLMRVYAYSYPVFYQELFDSLPKKGDSKYITFSKDNETQVKIKIEVVETIPVDAKNKKWYKFW